MTHLKLVFSSSGLKRDKGQIPPGKDLYIDCRALTEPKEGFYTLDGHHPTTQSFMREHNPIKEYVYIVEQALKHIPTRRSEKTDPFELPFRIHCFCAWGVHRSVAMKHILNEEFTLKGYDSEVEI